MSGDGEAREVGVFAGTTPMTKTTQGVDRMKVRYRKPVHHPTRPSSSPSKCTRGIWLGGESFTGTIGPLTDDDNIEVRCLDLTRGPQLAGRARHRSN